MSFVEKKSCLPVERNESKKKTVWPPERATYTFVHVPLRWYTYIQMKKRGHRNKDGENELTLWWMGSQDFISYHHMYISLFRDSNACWWRSRNEFLVAFSGPSFVFSFHFLFHFWEILWPNNMRRKYSRYTISTHIGDINKIKEDRWRT